MSLVISGQARLAALRRDAIGRINARAGVARGRFITIAPGQEMIYLGKEAEARRFLDLATPPADLAAFPFISAEVGITAPSAAALADLWVALAQQWREIGAAIEHERLGAVAAAEAAASTLEIDAAVAEFQAAAALIETLADA